MSKGHAQWLLCGLFVVTLLLPGCASYPAPTEQLVSSRTAIAVALEAGATQFAAAELESAREKAKLSERWIAAGDYQPARWLAEQAQVDAELAALKALSARAH